MYGTFTVLIEMSTDSSQDTFCPNLKLWSCSVLCEPLAQRLANVRKPEAAVSVTRRSIEYPWSSLSSTALYHFPWALSHDTLLPGGWRKWSSRRGSKLEAERAKGDVSLKSNSLRKVMTLGTPKEWVNKSSITKGVYEFSMQALSSHLLNDLLLFGYDCITAETMGQGFG